MSPGRILIPIALGLIAAILVSLRRPVQVLLASAVAWLVFLIAFSTFAGPPVGLLTSTGGWMILTVGGVSFYWAAVLAAWLRRR